MFIHEKNIVIMNFSRNYVILSPFLVWQEYASIVHRSELVF